MNSHLTILNLHRKIYTGAEGKLYNTRHEEETSEIYNIILIFNDP